MAYESSRRCALWVNPEVLAAADERAGLLAADVDTFIETAVLVYSIRKQRRAGCRLERQYPPNHQTGVWYRWPIGQISTTLMNAGKPTVTMLVALLAVLALASSAWAAANAPLNRTVSITRIRF